MPADRKTKKVLTLALIVAASAAFTSFLIFALSGGLQIQSPPSPSVSHVVPVPSNTSSSAKVSASSSPAAAKLPVVHQAAPPGFRGPTGPPHVNGPKSNPPNY